MEIKKSAMIFFAVFLLLSYALCAQEEGYYVDYSDGSPRFIQRLEWDSVDFVLHYEVLIYVNANGYKEYSKDTTEDNFLLVSLPPGKYRYSVTPYDLLGIQGETSQWIEFEVLTAYQPVIESFAPQVFFLDKNRERVLQISGDNLFAESEIFLQGGLGIKLYPEKITIANNRRAMLVFDDMELVRGSYNIHVINPGGLSAQLGAFEINYGKPLDFFLKLSWSPAIPVFGYLNDVLGPSILPGGLSFSFQAISSVRGNFNGGLELAASVLFLEPVISLQSDSEQPGADYMMDSTNDGTETFFTSFDVNIVLQRRFSRRRMAFSFRFGVGGVFLNNNFASFEQNDIIIQLNLGVDFLLRLYRDLCMEIGVDLNNHISPFPSNIIRPKLGVVWQF